MGRDCKMEILIMSIHGNVNAPKFWCHIMEPSTKNILVGYVIMMQFYQNTLIICFQDVLDCVQNVSKDSVIQEQPLLLSTETACLVDLPCYTDRELLWYTAVDHRSSHATLFPVTYVKITWAIKLLLQYRVSTDEEVTKTVKDFINKNIAVQTINQ